MADAKVLPDDTRDNAQEPESKEVGSKGTSKREKFPSADKSENDRDMEDQANHIGEAVEPKIALISVVEHNNTETKNEDTVNTKNKSDEQTGDESAVETLTQNEVKLIKENGPNGGMKEVISSENSVEDVHHVETAMEEKPSEDILEEITNEFGREGGDSGENVPGEEKNLEDGAATSDHGENMQLSTDKTNNRTPQTQSQNAALDEVPQGEDEEMEEGADTNPDKAANDELKEHKEVIRATPSTDGSSHSNETALKNEGDDPSLLNQHEASTPDSLVGYPPSEAGDCSGQTVKTFYTHSKLPLMAEDADGTLEEQAAFVKELESFYRGRGLDFKPPKFYQQPLNCLKLWRAVIRLGGYDIVTGSKLWRQVGESFHPPKTCTTVSWTFRIFYEKSLLEYEKYQIQSNTLQLPEAILIEASGVDKERNGHQGSEPGRARRDAASRAMQGWHSQRLYGNGEVVEPVIKNKNLHSTLKRERNFKSIGSLKQKRPNEVETSNKSARNEMPEQLVASVVDVGPPADWVKINVRSTTDCFEVYALVPGLLREEVKVQSDPAGRLVITGQPEQLDNPWGLTPFKKVVSLPARIDPLHTSAVVSLHGGLFVRVPYEQRNIYSQRSIINEL